MANEIVLYQSDDGTVRLETRLGNETLWLTQQQMTELFQTSKQNISHHIRSIHEEGELAAEATVKHYLTVQREGNREVQRTQCATVGLLETICCAFVDLSRRWRGELQSLFSVNTVT